MSAATEEKTESGEGQAKSGWSSVTAARLFNNQCGVAELGYSRGLGFVSISPVAEGKQGTYESSTYNHKARTFFQLDAGDLTKIAMALEVIEARRDEGKPAWAYIEHNQKDGRSKKLTFGTDLQTDDGSPSHFYMMLEEKDKSGDVVNSVMWENVIDEMTKSLVMSAEDDCGESEEYEVNVDYETLKAYVKEAKRVCLKAHELSGGSPSRDSGPSGKGDNIPQGAKRRALPTSPPASAGKGSIPKPVKPADVGSLFDDND
jgi:hypothetical protein